MTLVRDLPADERAKRIGCPSYNKAHRQWYVKVGGKDVLLGRDKKLAHEKWLELMLELGKGLAPGPKFYWNAIEQRWDKDFLSCKATTLRRCLKPRALRRRMTARQHLIAEKWRLKSEIADLRAKLDQECRDRRAACAKQMREQWAAFKVRMRSWRFEYRAKLTAAEQERFDTNRKRIKSRARRKLLLRSELLQRISKPWKDRETGLWYSWIGLDHRKLVRLGDDEAKARVVWWILRNALNEGAKMLRKPESTQRTIDELIDVAPQQVFTRLAELGWKIERLPDVVPNSPIPDQAEQSDGADPPRIS